MMNETKAAQIEADVRSFLHKGLDPDKYKAGLADLRGVDVSDVIATIARVGGTPDQGSPETHALIALAEEARDRYHRPAAWREYDHEE